MYSCQKENREGWDRSEKLGYLSTLDRGSPEANLCKQHLWFRQRTETWEEANLARMRTTHAKVLKWPRSWACWRTAEVYSRDWRAAAVQAGRTNPTVRGNLHIIQSAKGTWSGLCFISTLLGFHGRRVWQEGKSRAGRTAERRKVPARDHRGFTSMVAGVVERCDMLKLSFGGSINRPSLQNCNWGVKSRTPI